MPFEYFVLFCIKLGYYNCTEVQFLKSLNPCIKYQVFWRFFQKLVIKSSDFIMILDGNMMLYLAKMLIQD